MLRFIACLCVFFSLSVSFAQEADYTKLESGFRSGNEKIILTHVVDKILLNIDQKEAVYSKSQAEMILKDFFTKNPPVAFNYIFKGNKDGAACAVGIMECKNKKYRISITLKEVKPIFKLEQLNIEGK